jgi:hypothetical protein
VYESAGALALFLGTAGLMTGCLCAALALARNTVLLGTSAPADVAPAAALDPASTGG